MDALALLQGLVEQYSPTGQEAAAVTFFAGEMEKLGYRVQVDAMGNAVGRLGYGDRKIYLLGHIDTVPGKITVRVEGDALFGRGTVDAKGALACFAAACAELQLLPGWEITVFGAVGEEGDSRGAKYVLQHYPAPEALIVGEPSGWEMLTLGYKGSFSFRYVYTCAQSHSAANQQTASEGAVAFWNRLQNAAETINQPYPRQFERITPTLKGMTSHSDGFVETATLEIGMRIPPGWSRARAEGWIAMLAEEGSLEFGEFLGAFRAEKNTALVRAMLAAIRSEGGNPGFSLKTGTADMNLAAPVWNCPSVAYGPGDSTLDHTPDEHISMCEFLTSTGVLREGIARLMQTTDGEPGAKKQGKEKKPEKELVNRNVPVS